MMASMRMPTSGQGDAAAEPSCDDSLEYCEHALTATTALTFGTSSASSQYLKVEALKGDTGQSLKVD